MGGQHNSYRGDNLALKCSIGQGVRQGWETGRRRLCEHLGPQNIKARSPQRMSR